MKKITILLLLSFYLISCGNDTELKNDVKLLIELQTKTNELSKQSERLEQEGIEQTKKQNQEIMSNPNYDYTKGREEQMKIINQQQSLIVEFSKISEETKNLQKKLDETYKTEKQLKKFSNEYSLQMKNKGN
jgi:hypothetical protein